MTQKERLVELFTGLKLPETGYDGEIYLGRLDAEYIADYLLKNGVIVPPCKVGDAVWLVGFSDKEIIDGYVEEISYKWVYQQETVLVSMRMNTRRGWLPFWRDFYAFGDDVFLSKEAAERALKEMEQ